MNENSVSAGKGQGSEVTQMYCGSLGQSMFMSWGYIIVFFLMVEFVAVLVIEELWCYFIWAAIPVVGMLFAADGFYIFKNKESISKDNTNTLYIWGFVGVVTGISGFLTGITGFFLPCYMTFMALMCSVGSFMTSLLHRLHLHSLLALVGAALSFVPLCFQGDQWHWQLPAAALSFVFSMIIPGHLFSKSEQKEEI